MTSPWILTYTGRQFWPLEPRAEDIDIRDIAHALSLLCRFNGHVRTFYSVAQHCVLASRLVVHSRYTMIALLHDASEAYLCDVPRPLKQVFDVYKEAEARLELIIFERFGLLYDEMGAVRDVDDRLLLTERRDLMAPGHWMVDESRCYPTAIVPWTSQYAEHQFLRRFNELQGNT